MKQTQENIKNASKETLWSILSRYSIKIPRMQRNYAQGRTNADVTQKRENLLEDIFKSLKSKEQLDLNFIYGNIIGDCFYPIDGQQRLTTLFLLYWYFMTLSGRKTDGTTAILKKFKYETRDVTGKFCEKLVTDVEIDIENTKNRNLAKTIKDYYWFFSDFEYDASIESMLVMLQSIHEKALELGLENCKSFFDMLISNECPITFLFLDINDVGLTDEIYIKMNARGKPLTEFENFKAQLTSYLTQKDNAFADELLTKINCQWSQFFWAIEYKKKKDVFDKQIMNFIKFYMFNEFISNNNSPNATIREKTRKTLANLKSESTFEFTGRLFKDEFKNVYDFQNESAVVNEDTFRKIYKLLNALSKKYESSSSLNFIDKSLYNKKYFDENEYFEKLVDYDNFDGLGYEEQVLLFAEYSFIAKYSNNDGTFDKTIELTKWIRYIYNLSKAQLYNQQDDYYRSIKSISSMINNDKAINILEYAANMTELVYKQGRGFGFFELQAKEESVKAYLILKDPNWEEEIKNVENSYLDNQIGCLLHFAGVENNYDSHMADFTKKNPDSLEISSTTTLIDNSKALLDSFKDYYAKFNMFFDEKGLRKEYEESSIFRRALLTFGGDNSYLLIKEGQNLSFLNNTHRDYSFRRLLRDYNKGKRAFFKELLDSISLTADINQSKKQLNSLIDSFNSSNEDSWKFYFTSMPQILDCIEGEGIADPSGDYVFKKGGNNGRFINMKSKNEILLCEGQSTRSMNREYYSYVLYLKAIEQGNKNINYNKDFTEIAEKYVSFTNKAKKLISITYKKDDIDGRFKYFVKQDGGDILQNENIDYMLAYIKKEAV